MPKNKGKGGKNRKKGRNEAEEKKEERELEFKVDGQEYGHVLRMLGNGRCEAICLDGRTRLCHIRGTLHKKVWISPGDIVLLSLRDFQDDKADIILKYFDSEVRRLRACEDLPDNFGRDADADAYATATADDYFFDFADEDVNRI